MFIVYLEIILDRKMLLPKRKKTSIAIIFSLQSAQQRHYMF